MSQSPDKQQFVSDVYNIVGQIPSGKVLTYGAIARLAGWPQHSRMVGWALKNVGSRQDVPCHRVVNSQGRTAPTFQAQQRLLKSEGVTFKSNGNVDIKTCQWEYMQL